MQKPTEKESYCLTINFHFMKNEQEMLELFQVEELEKRYEMGKWSVSGGGSYNSTTGGTVNVSGTYTF